MWTSHRLIEAAYFATISLMLLRVIAPLIAMEALGLRRPADDSR